MAFNKNGSLTYIAYNFGCSALNVAYSDGTSFSVPAKGYAFKRTGQSLVSSGAGCSGTSSSAVSSSSSSVASSTPSSVASSSVTSSTAATPYGYTVLSSTSVRFHANNAAWADIHYTINNGAQQNIRMTHNANNSNTYDLTGIPAGATLRFFFTIAQGAGAMDTSWTQFTCCSGGSTSSTPASSSSVASSSAPAFTQLVQAEAFTAMNGVQTEATTDTNGGQNVSYIDAGDWMAYAGINIPSNGSYRIEYRVASPSGSLLSSDLNGGSIVLGNVTIPATGGWQNWTTVSQTVTLTAGTYSVGIFAQQSGWNLNWFRITKL